MAGQLEGKVAFVTGAASGIGLATAQELSTQGASVVAVDLKDTDRAVKPLSLAESKMLALNMDVSDEASVLNAVEQVQQKFGRLDIAINCAGIVSELPLLETRSEDFDRVISVNLKGTFLVGREAARIMVGQAEGGRIVNVASELAYLGRAQYSAYCASKSAILGLTRVWAREFAPHILVNTVAPGPTDTPMLKAEGVSDEVFESESDIPFGRIGRPEEIASVIAFLCGPGAGFVTGQTISPNGGALML